jgi:hypothetical protein
MSDARAKSRRAVKWYGCWMAGAIYPSRADLTPLPSAEVTIVDPPPPPFPGDLAEDTAIAKPASLSSGSGRRSSARETCLNAPDASGSRSVKRRVPGSRSLNAA